MSLNGHLEFVKKVYGDKKAARSGVPLINHITEGLQILEWRKALEPTKSAFVLHPLFQSDEALQKESAEWIEIIDKLEPYIVLLVMEYRYIANSYLSDMEKPYNIHLSPIPEVNEMLIADKVQNRKDFLLYNFNKIDNSERLSVYFNDWLKALGISNKLYKEYSNRLIIENGC